MYFPACFSTLVVSASDPCPFTVMSPPAIDFCCLSFGQLSARLKAAVRLTHWRLPRPDLSRLSTSSTSLNDHIPVSKAEAQGDNQASPVSALEFIGSR